MSAASCRLCACLGPTTVQDNLQAPFARVQWIKCRHVMSQHRKMLQGVRSTCLLLSMILGLVNLRATLVPNWNGGLGVRSIICRVLSSNPSKGRLVFANCLCGRGERRGLSQGRGGGTIQRACSCLSRNVTCCCGCFQLDGGTGDIAELRAMYAGGRRVSCYEQKALGTFAQEAGVWDGSGSLQEALRALTHDHVQQFHAAAATHGGLVCFSHGVGEIAYLPSGWLVAESVTDAQNGFAFGVRKPLVVSHVATELVDVNPVPLVEDCSIPNCSQSTPRPPLAPADRRTHAVQRTVLQVKNSLNIRGLLSL